MKKSRQISRREFIVKNCAAVGSASLFSSLLSLRLTAGAVSGSPLPGYKALICLFLAGGNDSYNMLIPRDATAYAQYKRTRSTLALPVDSLLQLQTGGQEYSDFGLHPSLPALKSLYDEGNAAFLSNVGTLIEPMTLSQYKNKEVKRPIGLFSHSDEQIHWQTMVPQVRGAGPKGWAGRMADCMHQANQTGTIGMNISLSGTNVLQTGRDTVPYVSGPSGAIQLKGYGFDPAMDMAVDTALSNHYRNLYQKTLAQNNRKSVDTAIAFTEATSEVELTETFPTTYTGSRFAAIARVLGSRGTLGMNRQIFFVKKGGWDHHKEVLNKQAELFTELNDAISAFWKELGHMGLQNDVVLFTASDFGRTLTSNGLGSDHAWGGNHFVLGGPVRGGKIYGQFPILSTGGPQDVGRGRLLPTTSVDAYGAEMASWFGVPSSELTTVFPNAGNFFDPISNPFPLGILEPDLIG
jgi:uncharacterized protein (DUF1501 family)